MKLTYSIFGGYVHTLNKTIKWDEPEYILGASADLKLSEHFVASVGLDFSSLRTGYNYTAQASIGSPSTDEQLNLFDLEYKYKLHYYSINLPISLGYIYTFGQVHYRVDVGVYNSINIAGRYEYRRTAIIKDQANYDKFKELGYDFEYYINPYKEEGKMTKTSSSVIYYLSDLGARLSIGATYRSTNIKLGWSRGLIDIFEDRSNYKKCPKTNFLALSVGYMLN